MAQSGNLPAFSQEEAVANEATATQSRPTIEQKRRRSYRAARRNKIKPRAQLSNTKLPERPSPLQPDQMPEDEHEQDYDPETAQPNDQGPEPDQPANQPDRRRQLKKDHRTDKQAQPNDQGPEPDQPANQPDRRRQLKKDRHQARASLDSKADKATSKPEATGGGSGSLMAGLRKARQAISNPKQTIGASLIPNKEAAIALGEQGTVQAQRAAWKGVHEAIEEPALACFWVPFLSLIPLGLFLIRFFMGNMLGKMFTISLGEFEVAIVPSMTATEFTVRGAKAAIFLALTLAWFFILFAIVYVVKEFNDTLWGKILLKLAEIINSL